MLFWLWLEGARRIVPRVDQRAPLVQQVHEEFGYFEVRRLHSMLCNQYWWIGMYQHVATYVGRHEVCDRVWSSFNNLSRQIQPLPIMGLGYRRGLDFVGPLTPSPHEAKYIGSH